jgi:hypothetical protein
VSTPPAANNLKTAFSSSLANNEEFQNDASNEKKKKRKKKKEADMEQTQLPEEENMHFDISDVQQLTTTVSLPQRKRKKKKAKNLIPRRRALSAVEEGEDKDKEGELMSHQQSYDSGMKTLLDDDLLNQLEDHYANVEDEVSDDSDLSDGLDEGIDTYVKIMEDLDENERKSKYKGKPQFSEELSTYFSSMSESDRAKMILELASETIDEKIASGQQWKEGASSLASRDVDLPPEDTNIIYKNANSNYNGLFSDDARILAQTPNYNADMHTSWNQIEGDDIDAEASEDLNNSQIDITSMISKDRDARKKKRATKKKRSRVGKTEEEQDGSSAGGADDAKFDSGSGAYPQEFNATATQMVVKTKHYH